MSRRNKPRINFSQGIIAWPVVALGVVLIGAAFFLLRQPGDSGGAARLAVDTRRIDYGYVKLGETRTIAINVTNTGNSVLRFREKPYIEVLEGCCPPDLTIGSTALDPGESTTIRSVPFMMHAGMDGPHDFGVHLITNDPLQPDLVVNVLSDWGP